MNTSMNPNQPMCRSRNGRAAAFRNRDSVNGLDYVEVSDDQLSLCVHFIGDVPPLADAGNPDGLTTANLRIEGGERITGITVLSLTVHRDEEDAEACLDVGVDRCGDFSSYRLCLGTRAGDGGWDPYPGFDLRYSCTEFSFKAACPSDLDCRQEDACPAPQAPAPVINYLAKDYASFRQLMLDRLAVIMPDWTERHAADVGITLVELLAYAADQLSYYQDAVATEAYLGTARQRISVRRHVRLVDYQLHEGLNARAWLTVWTDQDTPPVAVAECYFITGFPELAAAPGSVLSKEDLGQLPSGDYLVFEPVAAATDNGPAATGTTLQFYAAHSEMDFDTGGEQQCCLPRGSTAATLVDKARWRDAHPESEPPPAWRDGPPIPAAALRLKAGDVLIFEEIRGPVTGNPADADPAHRQAVRLTRVTEPDSGGWLVGIEWEPADALAFPLCLSSRRPAPDCDSIGRVSVARGNVLLVDHGRTVSDPAWEPVPATSGTGDCACEGSILEMTSIPQQITPVLRQTPLTFTDPVPSGAASAMLERDPRRGLPSLRLDLLSAGIAQMWWPRQHLLGSNATDRHFVVEMDDDGSAHLRFGDGELGRKPAAGDAGTAVYRVGNGSAGNAGRDSITHLVLRTGRWSGVSVRPRNPLPATGGTDPEPVAEAKLLAPQAFRQRRLRAVTAADYAELARQHPLLQDASAGLSWTGSWYEARVGADPRGTETPTPALLLAVRNQLAPFRRMGHDLDVVTATYVPLDIELSVCVLPHYLCGDIRARLLRLLGSRALRDGGLGFFHPDRLSFGTGIRLSALVAAAQSVTGVESVVVTRLQRLNELPNGELENGVLPLGRMEIARLDNDPDFPEHGRLALVIGGGQ